MSQDGKQQWNKSYVLSKRMRHGNWFPFLPRGSLFNASGSSKPKLLLMVQMLNKKKYWFLMATLKYMVCIIPRPFAPVAKMDSIRLGLAIAASKGWQVHHMDVKSAFLHGEI